MESQFLQAFSFQFFDIIFLANSSKNICQIYTGKKSSKKSKKIPKNPKKSSSFEFKTDNFLQKNKHWDKSFFWAHEISPLDDQEKGCGFYKRTYFGKQILKFIRFQGKIWLKSPYLDYIFLQVFSS